MEASALEVPFKGSNIDYQEKLVQIEFLLNEMRLHKLFKNTIKSFVMIFLLDRGEIIHFAGCSSNHNTCV